MKKNRSKGFSLLELTVTLGVIGIIFLLSMVSYGNFYSKNRIITIKDQLKSAIHYGKIMAYSLDRPVYFTWLPDKKDWNSGMAMYDSLNDTLLYSWHWKGVRVTWKGFESPDRLVIAAHPSHAASNGQFILSHPTQEKEMRLVINRMANVVESSKP